MESFFHSRYWSGPRGRSQGRSFERTQLSNPSLLNDLRHGRRREAYRLEGWLITEEGPRPDQGGPATVESDRRFVREVFGV